jgi:hypothetical protein
MESYVLRIYRREGARIVGLIEQTASNQQSSFHSAEELWAVLAGNDPPHANPGPAPPDSVTGRRRTDSKK